MSEHEPLLSGDLTSAYDAMPGGIGIAEDITPAAPKRTMSEAHKQKMAQGREAKRAQSRGRPAARHEAAPLTKARLADHQGDQSLEDIIDALGTGEHLTRERRGGAGSDFDVPLQGRRAGWDYQWWTTHIVGQEVDPSYTVEITRGSWFPVPASHFPQLCPPGWSRPTIDRQGQRLYMRPMRLTEEARAEAARHAVEQKQARLQQAQTGDSGREFAPRTVDSRISVKTEPLL